MLKDANAALQAEVKSLKDQLHTQKVENRGLREQVARQSSRIQGLMDTIGHLRGLPPNRLPDRSRPETIRAFREVANGGTSPS